jgi:hypothetical protein
MEHLSIIRSVRTDETDHDRAEALMHTGFAPSCDEVNPALGTIVSYELAGKDLLLPRFIAIDPPRIPQTKVFSDECLPYAIRTEEVTISNARRLVEAERDGRRRKLAEELNGDWEDARRQPNTAELKSVRLKAEDILSTPLLKAFDVSQEPEALRLRYGGRFGTNCLIARRLVQAGCPFVEVGLHGWDTHADNQDRVTKLCRELDPGMASLIRDLAEKDMLNETLVIWCGEFGRTPRLNVGKGRDHWAKAFSVVLAGGALAGGRVYGDTGPDGEGCSKPVPVHALFATIFKACGLDPDKKYESDGRKYKYVSMNGNTSTTAKPIKDLFY